MTSLTISRDAEPPADWRSFAVAHGTFYHRPEWVRCIRDAYRFSVECYSARRGGALQGFVAVAEVPALLGPRRLVSLPFSYAAGPLALDVDTAMALGAEVRERAIERRIRRVEIKSRGEYPPAPGFQRTSHYATYELSTDGGEAAVWDRLHPSSTQRSIRKAQKMGVVVRRGETADDWLAMAELEERTAHGHGLPSPPRRFFVEGCRGCRDAGSGRVSTSPSPLPGRRRPPSRCGRGRGPGSMPSERPIRVPGASAQSRAALDRHSGRHRRRAAASIWAGPRRSRKGWWSSSVAGVDRPYRWPMITGRNPAG